MLNSGYLLKYTTSVTTCATRSSRLQQNTSHGHALRAAGLRLPWHTGMAPKRKSAAADDARGDEREAVQRQRVRTNSADAEVPALPLENQLPPEHGVRFRAEGGAIAVSCAAALVAWVTAVAQRQGYSRCAGSRAVPPRF